MNKWVLSSDNSGNVLPVQNATSLEEFQKKLETGVVLFCYRRVDGSLRKAIGTICSKILPDVKLNNRADAFECIEKVLSEMDSLSEGVGIKENLYKDTIDKLEGIVAKVNYDDEVKEKQRNKNTDLITYFDLEAFAWRSFNKNNLLLIIE